MNSIKTLAKFFGWCTIINFGFYLLGLLVWMLINDICQWTAPMMGVTPHEAKVAFINAALVYRAGIFLFNLVPYIVLKIMDRAQADVRN